MRGGTPALNLGGHKLTKISTNQVSIVGATIASGGGSVEIGSGIFSIETTSSFSDSLGSFLVDNGGTLGLRTTTPTFTWPVTLNAGATIRNTGATATNYSPIVLAGNATLDANSQITTLNGIVSSPGGPCGLTKIGANTFVLTAVNTYGGNTLISAGILSLGGSGSIANSTNINIGSGATLDVSSLAAPFTLGSSQTLMAGGATGTVNGNLNLSAGLLAFNYANGTPTLTVTSGIMTLNDNAVTVTVSGSALPPGNYKLISAGTGGSVSGSVSGSVVTINGAGATASSRLKIISGELYLVVDHSPVAQPMTVTRTAGLALKVALSGVATNWSDVDGDTVTWSGINLVTTNGVSLTINSTWIFYTNNANVADQISYVISDGQGGTAAGLINVVMNPFVTGQSAAVTVGGGAATINFAGIPGYSYGVSRSTNLTDWVTIVTTNAPASGVFNYLDNFGDLGSVPSAAYYRLQWNP